MVCLSKRILGILLFFLLLLVSGCDSNGTGEYPFKNISFEDISNLQDEAYTYSVRNITFFIDSLRLSQHDSDYIDNACNKYYAERQPYLWVTRYGARLSCDTVLAWLKGIDTTGVNASRLYVKEIEQQLTRLRQRNFDDAHTISETCATLEYYLTKAYLRYSSGQRFGFVNPHKVLNRIDHLEENDIKSPYKLLYDVPTETPNKQFVADAINHIETGNTDAFLKSVQPENEIYYLLSKKLNTPGNTPEQARILAINIERARWRMPVQEKNDVKILVNIPAQRLYAYDLRGDSSCEMKICFGSRKHKTPLLTSKLSHIELNPYWIIPQNIVKKEIAPYHTYDTAYFNRNRYKIIDKSTGEFLSPLDVDEGMLLSGKYRIRQDKGEDNSLGRMIFRFPNNFSIYMHDTNNKAAFFRSYRGASHGCIRLEKPFALARFLMGGKSEAYINRIQQSITYTEEELQENTSFTPLKTCFFDKNIRVYIQYYTCYPHAGEVDFYPDFYGYDKVVGNVLFKPN